MTPKPIKLAFKTGAVLLGARSAAPDRAQERMSVMAMRLRIEELRLEHAKILAEEREKDRELARFRIEERRRLREDTAERERIAEEDAELSQELETGLARTRERLARSEEALKSAVTEQEDGGVMTGKDKKIAEEISQLFAGTWKPPE